ncbi:putative dehydrogenase [Melghirimyces profundicolus]|uniref:Putative dehydrogenase n=1 Tax=Melghirimyces profundicolus TaxID=1242148 RepID=A0A2T6AV25_9BACL|nr:Gfo/Idh/MocA family oxidoreductase [Melghirimyces profundicolus]PTX47670.1 putative dehydrogenase [Melghirimyces profundicolus]
MNEKNITVGIIGTGFMGKAHAASYQMFGVSIGMFASRQLDNAKACAQQFGVPRWTDKWLNLVKDPEIDCVDITVPNYLHYEVAMACIEEGKPFLIEKPLARNTKEARAIVEAAKSRGITGVYGENMRFKPAMLKLKQLLSDGALGRVIMIRGNEFHNGPFHSPWFWDAEMTGGGAVIDMGIHGLYALEWVMGSKVKRVYAEMDVLKWKEHCKNGSEDTAFVVLRFENGGIAELTNSWAVASGIDVRLEVYGTEGSAFLDSSRNVGGMKVYSQSGYGKPLEIEASLRPHVVSKKGWSFPVPDEWAQHGHAYEVKHFIDCVSGAARPKCTLDEGLRALELVEAIYESAKSGRPVEL